MSETSTSPLRLLLCEPATVIQSPEVDPAVPDVSLNFLVKLPRPRFVLAVLALARSDRLLAGCKISSAVAPTNTTAAPLKLSAASELLLSLTVRVSVVPDAVYVPVPISHAASSSMT